MEGGSTETTDGDVCPPDDGGQIDTNCRGGAVCPECYTCQPFNGVVLQESCQLLCEPMDASTCPAGLNCMQIEDKLAVWWQCQ